MQKGIDYMMWGSSVDLVKKALEHYENKYGRPPQILIVPQDTQPMEGMNVVVKAEKYVPKGIMYIGDIPVWTEDKGE